MYIFLYLSHETRNDNNIFLLYKNYTFQFTHNLALFVVTKLCFDNMRKIIN